MESVLPRTTTLSVVIPMFNEASVVRPSVARLRPVLDGLGEPYEVVAVDDGSADGTVRVLPTRPRPGRTAPDPAAPQQRPSGRPAGRPAARHRRLRGQHRRRSAGPAGGHPADAAVARAEHLDIVYGVRGDRSTDTAFKWRRRPVLPPDAAHGRQDRTVAGRRLPPAQPGRRRGHPELPERRPVLRLVVPWFGFPSGDVSYPREERAAGRDKYPLRRMFGLAADSISSFSAAPLRFATWLGLIGVVVCGALAIAVVVAYVSGSTMAGWPSLFVAVLFLGAVQLLCLGLLGEYVGRIYTAVQGRPAFFVADDTPTTLSRTRFSAAPLTAWPRAARARTDLPAGAPLPQRRPPSRCPCSTLR